MRLDESCLMPVVKRPSVVMVRGRGSELWDAQGKRYLDFLQGWATNSLGHCAPEIVAALGAQASRLITPSPALHNAPQLELARRLCSASGLAQAHFANSGAEANEAAIKLARKWGRLHRGGAFEIVTTVDAFHGRTLATMAASGKPGWPELFPPYPPGFRHVQFGDAGAVRRAVRGETVAILIEPVQGEAGVVVPPAGYLQELRSIADEHGLLLILDEVQTGIGRTGSLFAFEPSGIVPDILTLGKGLGGGVPLSAVLAGSRASCFAPGDQGGTYNGNPLGAAVGCAVLDVVNTPDFLADVRVLGDLLAGGLAELARARPGFEVRGRGLLQALVLASPCAEEIRDGCLERGLLINAARPNVIRFMPSLRVKPREIAEMLEVLEAALEHTSSAASRRLLPAYASREQLRP